MIVVFTAIIGECDSLKPAPKGADRCVCFTDHPEFTADPKGWELVFVEAGAEPRRRAWNLRALAHQSCPDADLTIWIDASFTLKNLPLLLKHAAGHEISALPHHKRISCYEEAAEIVRVGQARGADIAPQIEKYHRERFIPNGLSISCILVRANTPAVRTFNARWNAETNLHRGDNTQLSIDYAAWKAGLTIHRLRGTRHENPYAVHDHEDHKLRRVPYDTAVTR